MKKILGISLCALFAVSAANANIASQEYVDEVVGAIDTSGIGVNAGNIATNAGNIAQNTTDIAANTTAIAGINEDIAGMTANVTGSHFIQGVVQADGKVSATGKNFETTLLATTNDNAPTSKAVADYVAGQVSDLDVGALTNRVSANEGNIATNTSDIATNATNIQTNTGNITTLTGRVDGHDTSIAGLTQQVGINEGKINTLDEDIQAMDLTATTGDYVKVVSQSNGTVQATGASFDTSVSDTSNNAPTSKAVAGYVATNAVQTVVAGDTNGTIKVDGAPVAVTGLQAMAYKAAVTNLDITDETITNADISPTAAILSSKIAFTDAQKNALDSGITSGLVTQIGNNSNILKPSAACMAETNNNGCTLVIRNGNFSWEAVTRAEGEQ